MGNNITENEVSAPKVEKVSLKTIQSEKKKEKDAEFNKRIDQFLAHFEALTPEEKEIFLDSK